MFEYIEYMNFGAEDNAKVIRHSTSEVYVRFLVGLPAASAPNIALSHRIPSSSDFHQSQLIRRRRSLYTSFKLSLLTLFLIRLEVT